MENSWFASLCGLEDTDYQAEVELGSLELVHFSCDSQSVSISYERKIYIYINVS